ncbi:hypothetical protein [Sporosarcina sp. FSL K6-1508]
MGETTNFDSQKFLNTIILIVFLLLLVFGTTKLEELTQVEDIEN